MALHGTSLPVPGRWRNQVRGWVRFLRQFGQLAGPFWASEAKWRASLLTSALALLTVGQVGIAVLLNSWLEELFNALEQRALGRFALAISVFFIIAAGNAAIVTSHLWVKRRLQILWREWLTGRLLNEWMSGGSHYQISLFPGEHDNPDGRIAEDIRISTEYAVDLAHSLLYCALLLTSFTQILWSLSGPPEITVGSIELYLPGHLVWIAVLYSIVGSLLALLLGNPLIRRANVRQTAEADFRFGLARARESSLAIALQHGEADERRRFMELFRAALGAWNRQTVALSRMFLFSSSWSVLSQVFPIFVAAPRYIAGTITLGVLMQTAQAFQQMAAALSWPIDNFAKAAEWRASVERVQGLHRAVEELATKVPSDLRSTIDVVHGRRPVLAFVDCAIDDAEGRPAIAAFSAEIASGEHVLISGRLDVAVKLFKAVAGIWPWGRGRIELPHEGSIFFMPQQPYIPPGSLRDAVCYPSPPQTFDDEAIRQAMARVDLCRMPARLDERETWEQVLPLGQQQRIGFARLLLHRPAWIVLQEAADALDPESRVQLMQRVQADLPAATFITIDEPFPLADLHQRSFVVSQVNGTACVRETRAGPDEAPPAG